MPLLSTPHEFIVDWARASSQAGRTVSSVYFMRARDSFDDSILRWLSEEAPDFAGTYAPPPVGVLTNVRVERVIRRYQISSREPALVHAWNGTDVTQLNPVQGNGVGGVGVAGDWTLSFGSFPNDDGPAIVIANNNAVSSSAMWWMDDFLGDVPDVLEVTCRNLEGTVGAMSIYIVVYAASIDRYFAVGRASTIEQHILRVDPGSTESQQIGSFAPAAGQQDTTYGDNFGATVRLVKPTALNPPWMVGKAGGQFSTGWREAGLNVHQINALVAANADAGWLTEPDKTPKIGLLAIGGGVVGTNYIGGLAWLKAGGGI